MTLRDIALVEYNASLERQVEAERQQASQRRKNKLEKLVLAMKDALSEAEYTVHWTTDDDPEDQVPFAVIAEFPYMKITATERGYGSVTVGFLYTEPVGGCFYEWWDYDPNRWIVRFRSIRSLTKFGEAIIEMEAALAAHDGEIIIQPVPPAEQRVDPIDPIDALPDTLRERIQSKDLVAQLTSYDVNLIHHAGVPMRIIAPVISTDGTIRFLVEFTDQALYTPELHCPHDY